MGRPLLCGDCQYTLHSLWLAAATAYTAYDVLQLLAELLAMLACCCPAAAVRCRCYDGLLLTTLVASRR